MLNFLLGAMQNHHPRVLAALKRALRNQLPWQNVIVIAKSCAHPSIESSADPCLTARLNRFAANALIRKAAVESSIGGMICSKVSAASRCLRADNRR